MNPQNNKISWLQALGVYKQPKVVAMLFLGFSAGLPLLLVFGTLSFWLRKEGLDRTTIGYISWVAILYGFKFLWMTLTENRPAAWIRTTRMPCEGDCSSNAPTNYVLGVRRDYLWSPAVHYVINRGVRPSAAVIC